MLDGLAAQVRAFNLQQVEGVRGTARALSGACGEGPHEPRRQKARKPSCRAPVPPPRKFRGQSRGPWQKWTGYQTPHPSALPTDHLTGLAIRSVIVVG